MDGLEDIVEWSVRVLGNTLAAALQQTLLSLIPNADERAVIADSTVEFGEKRSVCVWISEAESGGMGLIEQFSAIYINDPQTILNAFYRVLQPGDYEQMDVDLLSTLRNLIADDELADVFEKYRNAQGYDERLTANKRVRRKLSQCGLVVSHTFATVLHSRLLRSGSSVQSDRDLLTYIESWIEFESKCGLCLLYTSPSPRDQRGSRMPSSA